MSSDTIHPLERVRLWEQRTQELSHKATSLRTLRGQLLADLATKEKEVIQLDDRIEKLLKVGELFKLLMDKMVVDQLETIKSIVTEGLKSIFYDLDLSFTTEVVSRRNLINVDLMLCEGNPDADGFQGSPLDNFGGGPVSIASLILRVISLRRLKKRPVLFLDETLSMVSEEYVEATGLFLKKLSGITGVDILLVTHNPSFLDHADMSFRAELTESEEESVKKLSIKRVKKC